MANVCEYCHEDSDGYIRALDRNGHAYVDYDIHSHKLQLRIRLNGAARHIPINYCPMCGRRLNNDD